MAVQDELEDGPEPGSPPGSAAPAAADPNARPKPGLARLQAGSEDETDSLGGQASIVRANLLGPLTFDDLYYT